jgi:sporulation protein YlmC with PRC-barrel domain
MIRTADLQGKHVRGEDGRRFGRVNEIHVEDGDVTVLVCGGRGLWQRFRASRGGHRVRWKDVVRLDAREILVRQPR